MSRRRVARAALIVVGIAFCLFGPSRLAAAQQADHGVHGALAVIATSASGSDHAIAERPSVSLLTGWVHQLSVGAVVLIAAALLAWSVAVIGGPRVIGALLGASWCRRGPPAFLV